MKPRFGFPPREERLAALERTFFDVLVVGGGITGAAIARDAATRGLKAALVEREDWASGTSWRSTKLIHGGLRYLQTGNVKLVFESLSERSRLTRLAPHLVRPVEFLFPAYRRRGLPAWIVGLGLTAYDLLALGHSPRLHRRLSREELLRLEPALESPALTAGAVYSDARTDDARLTLENVLDAVSLGAVAVSRVEVRGLIHDASGAARGAEVLDRESGRGFPVRSARRRQRYGAVGRRGQTAGRPGLCAAVAPRQRNSRDRGGGPPSRKPPDRLSRLRRTPPVRGSRRAGDAFSERPTATTPALSTRSWRRRRRWRIS